MKRILSGNEAIARGAWEAGVRVAAAYPGTPSTEILEELARFPHVYCEWSTNEKVAIDVAIGAAYAGRRALAAMKHVGLNVGADSFFYASYTGAEAGLVIVSADDPAMHSSQNEQDNRRYAQFARVPCLDPADSQEAKDFTILAFTLSETFDTPVLLRTTTRINHSATPVLLGERAEIAPRREKFPRNAAKYVMVPANARGRHPVVEQRLEALARWAETAPVNRIEWRDREVGIVTAGVAYQYAREVFPTASILKLGLVHPTPAALIRSFAAGVKRLIVLEELDPVLEEQVRLLGLPPVDGAQVHMAARQHRQPLTGAARGVAHQCLGAELPRKLAATIVQQHVVRARQQQPVVHHPLVATAEKPAIEQGSRKQPLAGRLGGGDARLVGELVDLLLVEIEVFRHLLDVHKLVHGLIPHPATSRTGRQHRRLLVQLDMVVAAEYLEMAPLGAGNHGYTELTGQIQPHLGDTRA